MLILTVIFVLLTVENCTAKEESESNNGQNLKFYVEVKKSNLVGSEMKIFKKGDLESYFYDICDTIALTCRYHSGEGKSSILRWIDNHKFETPELQNPEKTALRLIIKPDKDDNGLILTCRAYGSYNQNDKAEESMKDNISIKLTLNTGSSKSDMAGVPFAVAAIFGGIIVPGIKETTLSKVRNYQGTIEPCVYSKPRFTGTTVEQVKTYERLKNKTIHYIETDWDMSTRNEHAEYMMEESKPKHDRSSTVAIVGGILGTIILVLILVIFFIWYRKIHRVSPDDAANRHIYTDIEERPSQAPPQVPPPRHDEKLIAKVIGTLVQKQQPPACVDGPLYCVMTT